jgi:hypothetical protein
MRRTLVSVGVVFVAACFPARARGQEAEPVMETARFSFHSDPWINLHHFLYQWARADLGLGTGRAGVPVPERAHLDGLEQRQRSAWSEALDFYRAEVAERDHFDDGMLELKVALLGLHGDPRADPPDDIPGVAAALRGAMPVYLARWWSGHDRANRAWVADVGALVDRHEDGFPPYAERSFGGSWPDERIRVDASAYANWQGGYTSVRPTHTVIWSTDPGNRGIPGMEIVFHEARHDNRIQGPSRQTIRDAYAESGAEANGNLWRGLIFYTSGWYSRRVAEERGQSDYVPHMVKNGISGFAGWRGIWEALDAEWPAVLEGRRDRVEAMHAVVRAMVEGGWGPLGPELHPRLVAHLHAVRGAPPLRHLEREHRGGRALVGIR